MNCRDLKGRGEKKKKNKPEILSTVALQYKAPKKNNGLKFLYVYMSFTSHSQEVIDTKFSRKLIILTKKKSEGGGLGLEGKGGQLFIGREAQRIG